MKKFFLILLVAQSAHLNGAPDDFETGGSSKALFFFNKRFGEVIAMKTGGPYEFEGRLIEGVAEASNEFKEMVKEAQEVYQIPPEQRLPVYQAQLEDTTSGKAEPDAIYLNESLTMKPYGAQRFTVYHEVAHTQHCDVARDALRLLGSLAVGGIVLVKNFPDGLLSTVVVSSYGALLCTLLHQRFAVFAQYKDERRADEQAAKACKCFECLKEKSAIRSSTTKGGYLTKDELLAIAQRHEGNNLLCEYHRSGRKR